MPHLFDACCHKGNPVPCTSEDTFLPLSSCDMSNLRPPALYFRTLTPRFRSDGRTSHSSSSHQALFTFLLPLRPMFFAAHGNLPLSKPSLWPTGFPFQTMTHFSHTDVALVYDSDCHPLPQSSSAHQDPLSTPTLDLALSASILPGHLHAPPASLPSLLFPCHQEELWYPRIPITVER